MEVRLLLALAVSTLLNSLLLAQGNIVYSLRVVGDNRAPQVNLPVVATETTSLEIVQGRTNHEGKIKLELKDGNEWSISVGEIKKSTLLSAVPYNIITINELYEYDLKDHRRKKLQSSTRTDVGFEIIEQEVKERGPYQRPDCMLIIKLRHPEGKRLTGVPVSVVNMRDSLIYRAETNYKNEAVFIVPNNSKYDIDVGDVKNYNYADFWDEFVTHTLDLEYRPTEVNEKIVNDTMFQMADSRTLPSSERGLIRINVNGGKRDGVEESIYLRELKTGQVYATKTTTEQYALFLVPIGKIYMVDFNYQKDVDAINLTNARGMTTGEVYVFYSPDPRLEYPEQFIPDSERLLLKSFNSFLTKQFEKPRDKAFNLNISSARQINANSREALFMLSLASSDTYGADIRLPLNISLVLDKSGSMYSNERSESLKKSLWNIGNSMTDDDYVSIVLFDDQAVTVQKSSSNHLDGIERIIEHYDPSGGTNIYSGIQQGIKALEEKYRDDHSNRLILLTDGYGTTAPKEITDYVEAQNERGIEFSTIGLGNGYNQSLLKLIARKGNGTFSYVDSSVELSAVFLKEIKDAFNYLVTDLKVDVYYEESLIFSNLYGYPVSSEKNNQVSFEIKKLPANINQIAYLKFKLDKPSPAIESKPLVVSVSYFDLVQQKQVSYEEHIELTWTEETGTELLLDQEEQELYAIAILNQSLKVMAEAYDDKDNKSAKAALKDGIRQIEDIFPDAKAKEVRALFEDVNKYLQLFNQMEKNEK